MIYDCIIIGAGPAGLMSGCTLENTKSLIFEGESKAAQKLLLSGGGQCNFTHAGDIKLFFEKFGEHGRFVRKALSSFTNEDAIKFFRECGVSANMRDDGKVFPESMDAWDVFRALKNRAEKAGVEILLGMKVDSIEKDEKHFLIKTGEGSYMSKTVILATGGASYPMTGSDGSGHVLAKNLGHKIIPARPALTPVYIEKFQLGSLAGASYKNGLIAHYRDGRKIAEYKGDVLITHTGLSGPGILDNSRYIQVGDELRLRLLEEGTTRERLEQAILNGNKKYVKTIVSEFMTKRNAEKLIEIIGVDSEKTCAEFGKKDRKMLLSYAEGLPMIVKQLGNMKSAMVSAGGVSLKEVTAGTMASKICEGLYFAGEVLDVDGDSGGYNIQWAYSSGRMAALSAKKHLEKLKGNM